MSPFALQLKEIRSARKLQQNEFAQIIGCEQSYLSALETDAKSPPQNESLKQFLKKLELTEDELTALDNAAKRSKRLIKLPQKAKTQVFEVCYALEKQLPMISDVQLELIALALRLNPNEMGVPKM